MKYIFITFNGLGLPIAYQLQKDGHEVIVGQIDNVRDYVREEEIDKARESDFNKKRRLELYKGILDIQPAYKVISFMKDIRNPHEFFVYFEENNLYRWADKVKDLGFEGNFPTKEDYLFEVDRSRAKQFVSANYTKLYTPEVFEFSKKEDAYEFLNSTDELWVLKGNADGAKAYIPDTTDSSIGKRHIKEILDTFPEKYEEMGFILEKFLPSIVELTPERMYYDGVPLLTTIDIENKPFGAGNISVQTGCAADMVFPIDPNSRIAQIAFPPIIDEMAKKHRGLFIWDASLLVDRRDGKIYFGEFCSNRPGYNSFFTTLSQCSSTNDFFKRMSQKQMPLPLGTVGTSVRVFNLNRDVETEQISANLIVDYKEQVEHDIWLWDVKRDEDGSIVTVGSDWNLAVVTGSGKSINEAISKTYKNINVLSFSGAYYRSKDDYLSLDYPTSILNRLNYGLDRNLYQLAFNVKVGDIK